MYRFAARTATRRHIPRCAHPSSLRARVSEKVLDIGEIDVRSLAPTLAKILGLSFPTADLKPLRNLRIDALIRT